MKKVFLAVLGMTTLLGTASGRDYKVEDREPVRHTFSGDKTLDVDLANGGITVIGDGGNTIRVEGERVIRAVDQEHIALAKKEVTLDMNEKSGTAQLYENGPTHDNGHSSANHGFHDTTDRQYSDRQYEVAYNLTIHVPRETALQLKSVNGGVNAQDTSAAFDVRSVNGAITMTNMAGSGTASAVNGATTASFRESPKSDTSFKTVNGKIDITFPGNLSADLDLRTVNGGMYTDFESTVLPSVPGTAAKQDGKYVYKSRGESHIRVGAGGPHIHLETVNGSIQIRKK